MILQLHRPRAVCKRIAKNSELKGPIPALKKLG